MNGSGMKTTKEQRDSIRKRCADEHYLDSAIGYDELGDVLDDLDAAEARLVTLDMDLKILDGQFGEVFDALTLVRNCLVAGVGRSENGTVSRSRAEEILKSLEGFFPS